GMLIGSRGSVSSEFYLSNPTCQVSRATLGKRSYVREEKLTNRLKVAVDTGNGVSSLTTPLLLRRIGCRVFTINDNIDGRFPARNSEPRPENLGPLSTLVRQEKATFGVAHDGDGDRAVFV